MLEEQRYLNRLKNSELRQNKVLNEHYTKVTLPMLERKRAVDNQESHAVELRLNAFNDYQAR